MENRNEELLLLFAQFGGEFTLAIVRRSSRSGCPGDVPENSKFSLNIRYRSDRRVSRNVSLAKRIKRKIIFFNATRVCRTRVQQYNGNVSVCLKDRCEQVYERRQQTSKGPDKRRNRESA